MVLCLSDSADVARSLQILTNAKSHSSKLTLSVTGRRFLTPLTRLYNHSWNPYNSRPPQLLYNISGHDKRQLGFMLLATYENY